MDTNRLQRSLAQFAKTEEQKLLVPRVVNSVSRIASFSGEYSQNRQALFRIGKALLRLPSPRVLVPVCMNYASLSGEIPEIALRHVDFLTRCFEGETIDVVFLMPDTESNDSVLCKAIRRRPEEVCELIGLASDALRKNVEPYGWHVRFISEALPELPALENSLRKSVFSSSTAEMRLMNDAISRAELYARTMPGLSFQEQLGRTKGTALQYLALGTVAERENSLVCNHTTTNLSWYRQVNAAILHNPVSL